MKAQFNPFFILLFIFSSNFNLAMEQPPLTPRTQAIIVLHQKLKDQEEMISLLCQARNQDIQLAQLKEKCAAEQLNKMNEEIKQLKAIMYRPLHVAGEKHNNPTYLLAQAGIRGMLIAQIVINKHYICEVLHRLVNKSSFKPRIKALAHEAVPEFALALAAGGAWVTEKAIDRISLVSVQEMVQSAVETVKGKAVFAWNSCIESMIYSLEKELSMQVYLRLSKQKIMLCDLNCRKEKLLSSPYYSNHAEKEVKKIDDKLDRVKQALNSIDLNRKLACRNKTDDYLKLSEFEEEMKAIDTHITVLNSFLPQLKESGQLNEVSRSLLALSISAELLEKQELESLCTSSETEFAIPSPKIFYTVQEKASSKQSCECISCLNPTKQNATDSIVEFIFQLPEDIELDTILASTLEDLEKQDRKRESQIQQIS